MRSPDELPEDYAMLDLAETLEEAIQLTLGAASMTWNPSPSSEVYDPVTAIRLGKDLKQWVEDHILTIEIQR